MIIAVSAGRWRSNDCDLFVADSLFHSTETYATVGFRDSFECFSGSVEPLLYDHPQIHIGVVV